MLDTPCSPFPKSGIAKAGSICLKADHLLYDDDDDDAAAADGVPFSLIPLDSN